MANKWWVLASVACGTYMATLDSSIVNIALPTLTKEFGAGLTDVRWVVVIFLLVITCFLLPFGRLADIHGRKRVFQLGFFAFTAASALCGFSTSLSALVLGRALQGIGAAMLMANGPAILAASFPARERGSALGIMGMVVSAGLLSGPSLGGLLISHASWRTIFWVNIPVGIVGAWLVSRNLDQKSFPKSMVPFDWWGAGLQSAFLFLMIVLFDPPSISIAGSIPFALPRSGLVVGLIALLYAFLKIERRVVAPLFDLRMLRSRTFWSANLAAFLTFVAYSAVMVLMPFYFEEILGFSAKHAGMMMTAIPLAVFVVAPLSGRLSDRIGSRELGFVGATLGSIGLFGMSGAFGGGLGAETPVSTLIVYLVLNGIAIGLFQSPNNSAIMCSVPEEKYGIASALLATVRNLGLVVGTGLATSLFAWKTAADARHFHGSNPEQFLLGLRFALRVAAFVGFAAALAALGKQGGRLKQFVMPEKGTAS